jgi:hypothetical protein
MFNIKVNYDRIDKKILCDLEWVKDEDANVRQHLFTFDPYWLGALETAIRVAYDDLNTIEHQFRAKKPSNVEDDGHYLVRAFEEKTVAIRRTFPEKGPMWQILNDGKWCSADFLDSDVEVIGVMDLDMVHAL